MENPEKKTDQKTLEPEENRTVKRKTGEDHKPDNDAIKAQKPENNLYR
jgi:hypothetical protein